MRGVKTTYTTHTMSKRTATELQDGMSDEAACVGHVMRNVTDEFAKEMTRSHLQRNVRSNLKDEIKTHWMGHTNSTVGLQHVEFKDGKIKTNKSWFERTDVFLFQVNGFCNVFVEIDGRMTTQTWTNVEMDNNAQKSLEKHVRDLLEYPINKKYMEHEKHFLESAPWKHLDGLTPEEAVKKWRSWAFDFYR